MNIFRYLNHYVIFFAHNGIGDSAGGYNFGGSSSLDWDPTDDFDPDNYDVDISEHTWTRNGDVDDENDEEDDDDNGEDNGDNNGDDNGDDDNFKEYPEIDLFWFHRLPVPPPPPLPGGGGGG
jgi:hypothetical protein